MTPEQKKALYKQLTQPFPEEAIERTDGRQTGMAHQRHYESRSIFRSLALAGGADEKDLDRLTHPSPKSASEL